MITANQLSIAMGCNLGRALRWVDHINRAMDAYKINSDLRKAHFLAQIGHESGGLVYVRELATGEAYEGRKDLGNTQPGDGMKYRGRGLIQITGRANYKTCGDALGVDFERIPEFLEKPEHAAMSAAWFWFTRNLNVIADSDDILKITKRINGKYNGLVDRQRRLALSKHALGLS